MRASPPRRRRRRRPRGLLGTRGAWEGSTPGGEARGGGRGGGLRGPGGASSAAGCPFLPRPSWGAGEGGAGARRRRRRGGASRSSSCRLILCLPWLRERGRGPETRPSSRFPAGAPAAAGRRRRGAASGRFRRKQPMLLLPPSRHRAPRGARGGREGAWRRRS